MTTEDCIWSLVIKKLTHEASEQELQELHELLDENPEMDEAVKLMFTWWIPEVPAEIKDNSYFKFKQVLKRIREAEANLKQPPPPDTIKIDEFTKPPNQVEKTSFLKTTFRKLFRQKKHM
jgi:hypothetical protein